MRRFFKERTIIFFVLFCSATVNAEVFNASNDRVIVKFKKSVNVHAARFAQLTSNMEVLVPELNLYVVNKTGTRSLKQTMRLLQEMPDVVYIAPDHVVTLREAPNDTEFTSQWAFSPSDITKNISAIEAWNMTKGGQDVSGNDIVVAVVDGGADVSHLDLKENIWVNKDEIADNGVDDDGNGYVDDINGWNAIGNSGHIPVDAHATHVAGIVGASGNNNLQVTGINQKVKIMTVNGVSGTTSVVLKAYNYVLTQKKLWFETKGDRGANVVSTNSSFGVDFGDCKSDYFRPWDEIYTLMGEYGILSATATANRGIDVDEKGDVPTGCSSEAMISVTNTTSMDLINRSAGFGLKTIDIGAPGTDILSTVPGQSTRRFTGTSMATPLIAGAVALLHSAANKAFNDFYLASPKEASLALKQIILEQVDLIDDLKGRTVTGGRLNIHKAVRAISTYSK